MAPVEQMNHKIKVNTGQAAIPACSSGRRSYLSFPVLRQSAGLELLWQDGEKLQQCQAACTPVHPSPLLLEHTHHLCHCAGPGFRHCVESQGSQSNTQSGEHHLGARREAGDLGKQLRLQRFILVRGDVRPVAGDLGVKCVCSKVLDLWDLEHTRKWVDECFYPQCLSVYVFGCTPNLFWAQQGPTELPGLRGDLSLH